MSLLLGIRVVAATSFQMRDWDGCFYSATLCPFLITCGLSLESFIIRPAMKTVITVGQIQRGGTMAHTPQHKHIHFLLCTPRNNFYHTTCTGNRQWRQDCITQQKAEQVHLDSSKIDVEESVGKVWRVQQFPLKGREMTYTFYQRATLRYP